MPTISDMTTPKMRAPRPIDGIWTPGELVQPRYPTTNAQARKPNSTVTRTPVPNLRVFMRVPSVEPLSTDRLLLQTSLSERIPLFCERLAQHHQPAAIDSKRVEDEHAGTECNPHIPWLLQCWQKGDVTDSVSGAERGTPLWLIKAQRRSTPCLIRK